MSNGKTDNTSLIARLEALTVPDREVDWRVAESLGDIPAHSIRDIGFDYDWYRRPNDFALWKATDSEGRSMELWQPKPVTSSIDAAVALCERVLPLMTDIVIKTYPGGKYHHAEIESDFGDFEGINAPNPAIALLIATLKALDAKDQS